MPMAIARTLDRWRYERVAWLLAAVETLHNLEEAIWLPAWSHTVSAWHRPVGGLEFRFAVAVFTLFVYGVVYAFSRRGGGLSRHFMGGAVVVILFNVFVPHLAITLLTGRLAPGVVTGLLLNVPVTVYLLRRGLKEGVYTARTLAVGTAGFALVSILLLRLAFPAGRLLERGW